MVGGRFGFVLAVLAAGACCAAPIPTFDQLDKELNKYKRRANLTGESNAHLQTDGLAFYCMFDLFLTVLQNPDHPKYAETRKAWDNNYEAFNEQAGFIARFMGRNLFPLLISTSAEYAKGFKAGSTRYAPRFEPSDYIQPLTTEVSVNGKTDTVAWWHGAADADGDGTSNAAELKAVVPEWRPVESEGSQRGCAYGVTEADRDRFVGEALGCSSWRIVEDRTESFANTARE